MAYVDGFLLAVPKKNLRAYEKMAKVAAKVWKKHGALEYRECVGDDLEPDRSMGSTSYKKVLKLKKGETAVLAYIVYRSRADRDRVNKKVMADPVLNELPQKMPFDMKRMAYGGFSVLVER